MELLSATLSSSRCALLPKGGLLFETQEGRKIKKVTSAGQVSILSADHWNVSIYNMLHLDMCHDVSLMSYADDVAAIITSRTAELAQIRLDQVIIQIIRCMTSYVKNKSPH